MKSIFKILVALSIISYGGILSSQTYPPVKAIPQSPSTVWDTTAWSDMQNGIGIRILYKKELSLCEDLQFFIEYKTEKGQIPHGIEAFHRFTKNSYIRLNLTDIKTGKVITDTVNNRSGSYLQKEPAVAFEDLGNNPLDISFNPGLYNALMPGEYWGQIQYSIMKTDSSFWHGFFNSPVFKITLSRENFPLKKLTIPVPEILRLNSNKKVYFLEEDVENIAIEYRENFFYGYCLHTFFGLSMGCCSIEPLKNISENLSWRGMPLQLFLEEGRISNLIKIVMYETDHEPEHLGLSANDNGYRELLNKEIPIVVAPEVLDSLKNKKYMLPDYQYPLIPQSIYVTDDMEIRYSDRDLVPHEILPNENYKIGYRFYIGSEYSWDFKSLPRTPVFGTLLFQLPFKPAPDSPLVLKFALFEYKEGEFTEDHKFIGNDRTILTADYFIEKIKTRTELTNIEPASTTPHLTWQQCRVPRHLSIGKNNDIVFDETDLITLDFETDQNQVPILLFVIGSDTTRLSTWLQNPLKIPDFSFGKDSVIICQLNLCYKTQSPSGYHLTSPRWSKDYLIFPDDKNEKPLQEMSAACSVTMDKSLSNDKMIINYNENYLFTKPIDINISLLSEGKDNEAINNSVLEKAYARLRLFNINENREIILNIKQLPQYRQEGNNPAIILDSPFHLSFRTDSIRNGPYIRRLNPSDSLFIRNERIYPSQDTVVTGLIRGQYLAWLELFIPECNTDTPYGLFFSPQFSFQVKPSQDSLKTISFTWPRELKLKPGPILSYDESDLDTITFEINPDLDLDYGIRSNLGNIMLNNIPYFPKVLLNPNLPVDYIDYPLLLKPTDSIVFEDGQTTLSFKTNLRAFHTFPMQSCCFYTSDNFLWEDSLSITINRDKYDSLFLTHQDLYDKYTLLIPQKIGLKKQHFLTFESENCKLREMKVLKNTGFLTEILIDGQPLRTIPGLPRSPLIEIDSGFFKDETTRLRMNIYNIDIKAPDSLNYPSDRKKIWSGLYLIDERDKEYDLIEELYDALPNEYTKYVYRIPNSFKINDELNVHTDDTAFTTISFEKHPDKGVVVLFISGDDQFDLSPDIINPIGKLKFPAYSQDTVYYKINIYHPWLKSHSYRLDESSIIWSKSYKMPVTKKQGKKIRKLLKEKPEQNYNPFKYNKRANVNICPPK